LTYALFSLLALRIMPEIANCLRYAVYERRWPTVEATFLVPLWAAIALAKAEKISGGVAPSMR